MATIPPEAFVLPAAERGSLQQRIRQMVTEGVLSGRFRPGAKMPSSRGLAAHLQISRLTVTLAYAELVAQDYLAPQGRSGYYISDNAPLASELPAQAARAEAVEFGRIAGRFTGGRGVERPEDWERYPFPFIYGQADPSLFDHHNWRQCAVRALGRRDFAAMTADYYERDDPLLIEHLLRHILPRRGIAARDERKGGGFAGRGGVAEERAEALAGEVGRRGEPAEIGDGGVEVDEFDESPGDAGLHAGGGEQEGRAAAAFEEGVLIPPFTLAEVVAVVAE